MGSFAKELDVMSDVRLLNESLGIRKVCLLLFRCFFGSSVMNRISGIVLKLGITSGLTPQQLAQMYIRRDSCPESPSVLEKLVQECVEHMHVYQLAKKMAKTTELAMCRSLSSRWESNDQQSGAKFRYLSSQSIAAVNYTSDPYQFPEVGVVMGCD